MKHIPYRKTHNIASALHDQREFLPKTVSLIGTVKLHGTNGGIVYDVEQDIIYPQSRNNVLDTTDNAGFKIWVNGNATKLKAIIKNLASYTCTPDRIDYKQFVLYGEWCGGNIQGGVGINGLPLMFVAFDLKAVDENGDGTYFPHVVLECLHNVPDMSLYNIYSFKTFTTTISTGMSNSEIGDHLWSFTEQVEQDCPVARYFKPDARERLIGEGVVWRNFQNGLIFKLKGDEHAGKKSGPKKVIDPNASEQAEVLAKFVNEVLCPVWRLEQALQATSNPQKDVTKIGAYLSWVWRDIESEHPVELSDMLMRGYGDKNIKAEVTKQAKEYFVL